MKHVIRTISILLMLLLVMQASVIPAFASETQELSDSSAASILKRFLEDNHVTEKKQETEKEPKKESSDSKAEKSKNEEQTALSSEKTEEQPAKETDKKKTEKKKVTYSYKDVPLYFQNDYPNTMYGSGTIESSGCSITALAMVATFMTDHEYSPDDLARYFGGKAANNIKRLEYGSQALQLAYSKAENWHYALRALQEGKVVIALMNEKSIFTDTQHFIVLTGINEDGKIMVNDPYAPNYDKWELQNAFENGFDEGDICCGYSGAWIYDKNAMPQDPFIYVVDEPYVEPRYPDIILRKDDRQLLARMIWVEARGESFEGQQAVAEVVLNRLASGNFQDTLAGVIYAENQFRSTKFLDTAEPYQTQYDAIERALKGPYVLPMDVMYFATYPVNDNVWGQIGGHIFCAEE